MWHRRDLGPQSPAHRGNVVVVAVSEEASAGGGLLGGPPLIPASQAASGDVRAATILMDGPVRAGCNECPAKYGMCMVCSFVPFRSREHDENTLRTAHPAVIFASHMCLVCGWVWVLDMNTRQQYMKPFYTGTLDINRSQTVPDPGTIGDVPDSIISTNTIHAHHPACKVLQLHLPCTNPAFMQMECIVKT